MPKRESPDIAIDAAQVEAQTGATPRIESPERAALRELVEAGHKMMETGSMETYRNACRHFRQVLARAVAVLKGGDDAHIRKQ